VKIESIKPNIYPAKPSAQKEVSKNEEQPQKQTDSIEISSKAQQLNKIFDSGKNLDLIREKINSGFYNSDEVVKKVADAILKEINTK
jgi:negative regulator of flagellin synthesis FlgM